MGGSRPSFRVAVAILMVDDLTITGCNALDGSGTCGELTGAGGSHRDTPHRGARLRACWHHDPHHIPRLEAAHPALLPGPCPGEASSMHQAHLATLPSRGR